MWQYLRPRIGPHDITQFARTQTPLPLLPISELTVSALKYQILRSAAFLHVVKVMATQSRLSALSNTIQSQTQAIEQYLNSKGLSEPSFKLGAPLVLSLSPELCAAQSEVVEAATELLGIISGPVPYLANLIRPAVHALFANERDFADYVADSNLDLYPLGSQSRIAHKIRTDELISYADLTKRCGLDESDLRRVIKECIAWQVFSEPQKGFVAHNACSLAIAQTPFLDDYIGASLEILHRSAAQGAVQMQK